MTRRAAGTHTRDLFEIPQPVQPLPGSMDFRPVVSELIAAMLAEAARGGMDRHEVAAQASRLTGKDVTKNMLWLAPVLEIVCCGTPLAAWHAAVHGGRLSVGAETLDAEIGRLSREQEQVTARMRQLKDLRRRAR